MIIKSIRSVKNLNNKTVFLRLDLNAPIKNKTIKDDNKLARSLPTIRFLLRHDCRLIIATHLSDEQASAKPLAKRLAELIDRKIKFIKDGTEEKTLKLAKVMKAKDILFLENLRFYPGEEDNSKRLAGRLAALADIYVNDAFAVCHRPHASVSAIKKFLPSYAGLLLEKEIANLEKILKPKQPLVLIVGGAKIETKLNLLYNLAKKSYRVLIGGALANNFILGHGYKIGRSLSDPGSVREAKKLIRRHKNIILPVDVVVAKNYKSQTGRLKAVNQVGAGEAILDIGPKTVKLFSYFIKQANSLIWNGPMGYFENPHFKHGTLAIARLVASRSTGPAFGVVGGGETTEALEMTDMKQYIDWVSTGGGAMLAFLGGKAMPGLKGLVKF